MSYFTRKNILAALIIILLVINGVTLATFIFRPGFIFHRDNRECRVQRCPADFFREELGLSEEQFQKFDKIRRQHMDTINVLAGQMKAKRILLSAEMMKAAPDSALIFKTTDELGVIYSAIHKINLLHYWHLRSMCSDEQKQKLDSIYKGMFCCKEGMAGPCRDGSGPPGCRRDRNHGAWNNVNKDFSQSY
jgi:hypothetical protein